MSKKYAGSEWVKSALEVDIMSPLGEAVADLLGDVFAGIYHLDEKSLSLVDWNRNHHIEFRHHAPLSSYDGGKLTRLIVLAYARMIRVEIRPRNHSYLTLVFHQRKSRGHGFDKMPYLTDTVKTLHDSFGSPISKLEDAGNV